MRTTAKLSAAIIAILLAMAITPIYAQWGFKVGEEMKIPSADAWNFVKHGEVGADWTLQAGECISVDIRDMCDFILRAFTEFSLHCGEFLSYCSSHCLVF